MEPPYIASRATLDDACRLIDRFGEAAPHEAAERAARSRAAGNVRHFCHWRQIGRLLPLLEARFPAGTVH